MRAYKERKDANSVKEMMGKVHKIFHNAGMPEDRIDYIIEKWGKSVYPEALAGGTPKSKMCEIAEMQCVKDNEKIMTGRCGVQWKACSNEIEASQLKKRDDQNYLTRCYRDKECHAKTDFNKIMKTKYGFLARLNYFREKHDTSSVKKMMGNMHKFFQEAGVPDDQIDYIMKEWVNSVYPEALQVNAAPITV